MKTISKSTIIFVIFKDVFKKTLYIIFFINNTYSKKLNLY